MGIHSGPGGRYAAPPGVALFGRLGSNRPAAGSLILLLMLGLLSMTNTVPAFAAPVTQVTVEWADGTPAQVAPGGLVTAEWRINVNDDAAAPSNAPVDNVTFTATAGYGKFASLPDVCKTTDVTPVSSISADGKTLVCNLGTVKMGTAVAVQTPLTADGNTGDNLTLSGSTSGGATANAPPIPIVGKFGMDITWESPGTWTQWVNNNTAVQVDYQWTLNLLKGSEAGPNSVSYTINLSPSMASVATALRCEPFTGTVSSGHPWSGGSHPANQTAPFVGSCTLTPTGVANQFTMTLTGIDYSQLQVPTKDSGGNNLPTDRVAVASGQIVFQLPTTVAGSLSLTSSAPTYTSNTGQTSTDDAANNTVSKTFTLPGTWASVYYRGHTGQGGTNWDNNYRAAPGTTLDAGNHSELHTNAANQGQTIQQCTVLDTAYVTYAKSSPIWPANQPQTNFNYSPTGGTNYLDPYTATFLDGRFNYTRWYYVGTNASVTPGSGSYNPEAFAANCDTDLAGWTTTLPSDLSTIKAVRTTYQASGDVLAYGGVIMLTYQTIKANAPVGQDIWQFSSYKIGAAGWGYTNAANWAVTSTPGARYPYTTAFRDLVRVTGVQPYLEKRVDRAAVAIGDPAFYTIGYAANGGSAAPPTVDNFVITDTLPVGMTYVAGSASTQPVVSTNGSGQQVLTWTLNAVPTNQLHALTYQAVANASAEPGQKLTNSVDATAAGMAAGVKTASVTVSENGYTTVGKTADAAFIPNVNGDGSGAGSWTVTLKSFDPTSQSFTDTIDILPYNGDDRGTSFTGSYSVTGVTAVAGATVYYTRADPATLKDDPADASNGSAGHVSGNTVGWTTTKPSNPTAVRVIGPALAPGATQSFKVAIQTTGATGGDVLVNKAQARAEHTELGMLTSAPIRVANFYSASLKKYVKDKAGVWHDANDVVDYPTFLTGDTVPYRIVVTNTGQGTLNNIKVADDKYPTQGGFTISSLAPGASQTHEFSVTLGSDVTSTFVNTASASADVPQDSQVPPSINIDPAGIEVANYTTAKSSDPVSGSNVVSGQKVTYTVKVTQSGSGPASAVFSDDLSKVLDDATYNNDVSSSIGSAAVSGTKLSWSGTVPVGGSATITYSVTVKSPTAGDRVLTNVVSSPGCVPVDGQTPDCTTTHRVPINVVIEKIGESAEATWVPMDGSAWAIHDDASGAPGAVNADYTVDPVQGKTGRFQVSDIAPGTYWLEETRAPDGFSLLAEAVQFTVAANGSVTIGQGNGGGVVTAADADGDGTFLITVRDVPALQMPETGGTGPWPFITAGAALLLTAFILILANTIRRRRNLTTA